MHVDNGHNPSAPTLSLCCWYHPPTTGHVPDIMGPKGPWSFINWRETYGSLFKLQIADVFVVSLTDPDVIAQVTRKTGGAPAGTGLQCCLPCVHISAHK